MYTIDKLHIMSSMHIKSNVHFETYCESGYFCSRSQLRKLILRKRMHTINVNVVRGRSYEKFSTQKFIIRKFPNTKISRSTVRAHITDWKLHTNDVDYHYTLLLLLTHKIMHSSLSHLFLPLCDIGPPRPSNVVTDVIVFAAVDDNPPSSVQDHTSCSGKLMNPVT